MRLPYFKAKDLDSDDWVTGFYTEFPKYNNTQECEMVHAITFTTISPSAFDLSNFTGDIKNTVGYCTIDINTLTPIGEVEIGESRYNQNTYIKPVSIIRI